MSESQSHQIDEQPIIYQEQQVLWAKIRGYPWWPAFVDKVHGAKSNDDQQHQYTVFFFGDNTHSRLAASKLRRFLDYYTEFYPKAKTNRKLYLSIMKAQQKLKQNGGNVQIFQSLRNSMKKPKKGKGPYKTDSKISSQDHAHNMLSQMPELLRHKTYPNNDKQQCKQIFSSSEEIVKQQRLQPKRRGRKPKKQMQKQEKQQQKIEIQQSQQQKSEQKKQQSEQLQLGKKVGYRTRSRRGQKQIAYKVDESKQQKQQSDDQEQSVSENQQNAKKNYTLRLIPKTKVIVRNIMPKKRGRPKKIVQQLNPNQQSQQNSQSQQNNNQQQKNPQQQKQQKLNNKGYNRVIGQARKTRNTFNRIRQGVKNEDQQQRNQVFKQNNQAVQETTPQQKKQLILERVKFCIDKRQQLIQYLDELHITTDVIQQILDCNVTNVILADKKHTEESVRVLQKLRSALLYKYFPEDIKHKKKYDKFTKKSQSRGSTAEHQESLQDLQLRRKTIIKLQKILRSIDEGIDQKKKAIQIELFFRKFDENIGNSYKSIAYKVLRSLKDKSYSTDQIISKLESGEFDDIEK